MATPEPSPTLKDRLKGMLPAHCVAGNPVDLTGDVISDPGLYRRVLDETKGEYDYQVVIFGDLTPGASQVVTPGARELVVFLGGADVEREERQKLYRAGIPVFPTPERGIAALAQFYRFSPLPLPESAAPAVPATPGLRLLPAARKPPRCWPRRASRWPPRLWPPPRMRLWPWPGSSATRWPSRWPPRTSPTRATSAVSI